MNSKMKARLFLSIAAVAMLAMACSTKNETVPEKIKGVSFKATVKAPSTKALTDNGTSIGSSWAVDETVALVYSVGGTAYNSTATVEEVNSSGTATITATLQSGITNGTAVTLIYPASAADGTTGNILSTVLTSQDGTLSNNRDVRKGTGTISVDGTDATLNGGATLAAQYAICKFSVMDVDASNDLDVTSFVIKDASDNIITTVTPGSATNELYVSLPASSDLMWFEAIASDKPYVAKGTASLAAGKFYTPTVKMATIGNVIGANGKFYKDKADAVAASTLVSAVIVYLGDETAETGYKHGLAVSTKAAGSGTKKWAEATGLQNPAQYTDITSALAAKESGSALCSGKDDETNFPAFYNAIHNSISSVASGTTKDKPSSGTSNWFLPSLFQWNQIIKSVNGTNDNLGTTGKNTSRFYYLTNCVKNATGSDLITYWGGETDWWTSTEYSSGNAWRYVSVASSNSGYADNRDKTVFGGYVLAALAF